MKYVQMQKPSSELRWTDLEFYQWDRASVPALPAGSWFIGSFILFGSICTAAARLRWFPAAAVAAGSKFLILVSHSFGVESEREGKQPMSLR